MLKQGIFYKTLFATLCLLLFLSLDANAQRRGRVFRFQNILEHDLRPYHFGFTLGVNTMNFAVTPVNNLESGFDFGHVLQEPSRGFHVGIVSNLKLGRFFDLRFVPTYVHHEDRLIEYYYPGDYAKGSNPQYKQEIETNIIDFPIHLKYKSVRMNNWRAYVIGGLKYSLDLRNPAGTPTGNEIIYFRIEGHNIHYDFGVGFDHYFYYFKFSTEIKASFGLRNLVLPGEEASRYYDSIDRLNSRSIMISFLFE